jgi:hypothetical protein
MSMASPAKLVLNKIRAAPKVSKMTETNDIPNTSEGHQEQDDAALKIVIVGGGIAGLATVSLSLDH